GNFVSIAEFDRQRGQLSARSIENLHQKHTDPGQPATKGGNLRVDTTKLSGGDPDCSLPAWFQVQVSAARVDANGVDRRDLCGDAFDFAVEVVDIFLSN